MIIFINLVLRGSRDKENLTKVDKSFPLDIEPSHSVSMVKKMISDKEGIP